MGERIYVAGDQFTSITFKYDEVLSLKELYKFAREWMVINGYMSPISGYDEKYYMEKVDQSGAKEIWVWWRTSRVNKQNVYVKFFLNVDFHIMGLREVEVTVRGQKVKANKGEVEIMVNAYAELDHKFPLAKHSFIAPFLARFNRTVYKPQIEFQLGVLKKEATGLVEELKRFLELKPFSGGETFNPPKGL